MIRTKYWLVLAALMISSWVNPCLSAEKPDETVTVALSGQLETSIHRFGQASERILWFSTPATQEADFNLAKQLAAHDLEIWLTPLQARSKKELTTKNLNPAALAELIEASLPSKPSNKLYIFSIGDSAKAAVEGLKTWQEVRGHSALLGGLILAYPDLQLHKSKTKSLEFIEATYQLKLPVYIFQTTKTLKLEVTEALVTALEEGGSLVYSELLNDTTEGYLQGKANTEEEILQASVFPAQLAQALASLAEASIKQPTQPKITETATNEFPLQEYPTQALAPDLRLTDLAGKIQDLKDYRGKVVLLNFWATWCPPCIKEIPSLNRLQKKFSTDDFVVLSVDIGEELKEIKTFLEHVPADYPVLVDSESSLVEPWQLRAFPSTYIIDRQGQLRYQYFGGLEWDEPEIIKFLEKNLEIMAK